MKPLLKGSMLVSGAVRNIRRTLLAVLGLWLATFSVLALGSWLPLANRAPGPVNLLLILPDGTVMAGNNDGITEGKAWYKLSPDTNGHYLNGTWTNRASMTYTRLFYSSQVLTNGRVIVAGAEYGTGGSKAEGYDPVSDIWTNIPIPAAVMDPSQRAFSFTNRQGFDGCGSMTLPDGRVLFAPLFSKDQWGTVIYNPVNNSWVTGPPALNNQNEASWVKLPDNSILTVDFIYSTKAATNTERYVPALNKWIKDANTPVSLYNTNHETGAALLLPSGKAFYLGGNGNTAIYTPSGDTNAGTWAAGANIPAGLGVNDGPAAMLANGKVLCVAGNAKNYDGPNSFFEYDPAADSFTGMVSPAGLTNAAGDGPYRVVMLDLPDGSVLVSRQTNQLYLYVPDGVPLASSRPVITSITNTSYKNYVLTGTLLNGTSAGAAYGDDAQMDGNFPLVFLTATNGNVFYARTYNWSSTRVMASTVPVSTAFTLPATLANGTYSVNVTSSGNTSAPVLLSFTNDTLQILPPQGITFAGNYGGPFNPVSQSYVLTNQGSLALNWRLSTNAAAWLAVSNYTGPLAAGKSTNAYFGVTSAARTLDLGIYAANVYLTNQTAGSVQPLLFRLLVGDIVLNGDFETGDFTSWTLAGDTNLNYVTSSANFVYNGDYGAALGQGGAPGTLSQKVEINTNQLYLLSFWWANLGPSGASQFKVSFNGTNLLAQSNIASFGGVNQQFIVSSPVETNLLQFSFQNNGGYFALDYVYMQPLALTNKAPIITQQPDSQIVATGDTAAFNVTALGALPLRYQWSLGGTNLPGATNSLLLVTAATNTAGIYRVTVINSYGSVLSSNAILSLSPPSLAVNGGFESGDFSNWMLGVNPTNVYVGGVKTNASLVNSGGYGAILCNSNLVGSLSQYVFTEFNQYYLISFTLANSSSAPTNFFNVYWNGAPLFNYTNLGVFGPTPVQLIAKAPSMATQLTFSYQNDLGCFGLDNILVVPVPVPVVYNITWVKGVTGMSWNTYAGLLYQLQYTTNLLSGNWQMLGNAYYGSGLPVSVTDPAASDPHRFYRVTVTAQPFVPPSFNPN